MRFGRLSFVGAAVLAVGAAFAIGVLSRDQDRLPDGFMAGNGRIEAEQVEIAPKTAGRVDRVFAAEGALVETGDILVEMDTDELNAQLDRANAELALARQGEAEAEGRRIATQIDDSTLLAPMPGRVLYRLAEPGEVVSAGGPILTLLSLEDVYMEVFLPAREAGLLPIGAEARIVLAALPDFAIPASVSFVSPEAQFTPKQVETLDEREKLVFRVRVRIPPELIEGRIEHVKTGLRGVAVVRLDASQPWPDQLERRIPPELFE